MNELDREFKFIEILVKIFVGVAMACILLVSFLMLIGWQGCTEAKGEQREDDYYGTGLEELEVELIKEYQYDNKILRIDGHDYISLNQYGTNSITHSGSCLGKHYNYSFNSFSQENEY